MTPDAIDTALISTLNSSWATATEIAWPNHNFKVPENLPWIRPVIVMSETEFGELGDEGVSLRHGMFFITIFLPQNIGTKVGKTLANRLEQIYRRKELSGVITDEVTTTSVGIDDDGFYEILVSIPIHAWIGE
ncbi:MAG: phage tail terminator-like protein [Eubacteriales bacterium]|jgi:hypothetical protein